MELWKVIEGFEAYAVSNLGRVRRDARGASTYAGRILKLFPDESGYLRVSLQGFGKKRRFLCAAVHRLVARAFIPNPLCLPEVNHKGTKTENQYWMLEWRSKAGHKQDIAIRNQWGEGVSFIKARGKWMARYNPNGKETYLGLFPTKEEALAARKDAVGKLPYIL
jgi:hypothetical protein